MNIAIEARSLSAIGGGVKTYTYELIKNLLALHPEEAYELLYGTEKILGTFTSAQETVLPLRSEVLLPYWMSVQVARHIRHTKPSLAHFTKAALPYTKYCPTVVTVYDIIPVLFPETQSPLRRLYWPYVLEHAAKTADHIMTISEQSKKDIIEHYNITEDKITVTPLAVDPKHFVPIREKNSQPYILFVGTRDARKNISSLIRAFAQIANQIPHTLIIAGRPAKKTDDSKRIAHKLHLEHRIEFREDVSYAQLPGLYSNADIFVWPSLYEGWGFPPQEAMACGTPVIVSNGGALPEVVGDAGIVVSLQGTSFDEHLAHEMLALIHNEVRKKELSAKGIARVAEFSWNDVAQKTMNAYRTVANI